MLFLYKILTTLSRPLLKYYLKYRLKKGKEEAHRLRERYGASSVERPEGTVIWCHGASVGESLSLLPVVEALQKKGATILVTTGTVSSAYIMAKNLPATVIHQYIPLDVSAWVNRFLDHWKPSLGIFVESELWPNLLYACHCRQIPLILANAHLSARSFNRWKFFPKSVRRLLSYFSVIFAQSPLVEERLVKLGAMGVRVAGNLKFSSSPLPYNLDHLTTLKTRLHHRPLWAAVSTHEGEEELILKAHHLIKDVLPTVLTILIPRHPHRAAQINSLIEKYNFKKSQRSLGELPQKDDSIYMVDTLGETGLFYRLCPISFLGGTLVPIGGHNPIEPINLKSHVIWGPYHHNYEEIASLLKGGITCITTVQQLADKVIYGLQNDQAYEAEKAISLQVITQQNNSLIELMETITFFLNNSAALACPLSSSFFDPNNPS